MKSYSSIKAIPRPQEPGTVSETEEADFPYSLRGGSVRDTNRCDWENGNDLYAPHSVPHAKPPCSRKNPVPNGLAARRTGCPLRGEAVPAELALQGFAMNPQYVRGLAQVLLMRFEGSQDIVSLEALERRPFTLSL